MRQCTIDFVPESLGRYDIVRELGRGAMGVVYLAEDRLLGRQVALKTLPSTGKSGVLRDRLIREARVCARLDHPGVIRLHDIGHDDGVDFLVMEYVMGRTLGAFLRESKTVPPMTQRDAAVMFRELLEGVEHAHGLGIVHRDLKPENIMVTPEGHTKIMDFGLAWQQEQARLTREGAVMGSLAYFSPEQARGERADERSDLYSLGAVFFEMVTGHLVFEATTAAAMIFSHLQAPPPSLNEHLPDAAPELDGIIRRCLQKNSADRYPSARAILQELEAFLREGSAPAARPTSWPGTGGGGSPFSMPAGGMGAPPFSAPRGAGGPAYPMPGGGVGNPSHSPAMGAGAAAYPLPAGGMGAPPFSAPRGAGGPAHPMAGCGMGNPSFSPAVGGGAVAYPLAGGGMGSGSFTAPKGGGGGPGLPVAGGGMGRASFSATTGGGTSAFSPAGPPGVPGLPNLSSNPTLPRSAGDHGTPSLLSRTSVDGSPAPVAGRAPSPRDLATTRLMPPGSFPGEAGAAPPGWADAAGQPAFPSQAAVASPPRRALGVASEGEALVAQGVAAYRRGDKAEARRDLMAGLAVAPMSFDAHLFLGRLDLGEGSLQTAETYLQAARRINPMDPRALNDLARLYQLQDRRPQAMEALRQSLGLAPGNPDVRCRLAGLLVREGRTDEGIAEYERGLESNPDYLSGWRDLARHYVDQDRVGDAARAYEAVVRLAPTDIDALRCLVRLHGRLQNHAGVEKACLAALPLAPRDAGLHVDLAAALEGQENHEAALRALEKAADLEPTRMDVQERLAAGALRGRHPSQARAVMEQGLQHCPQSSKLHLLLADLCLMEGQADQACDHFERGLELDARIVAADRAMGTLEIPPGLVPGCCQDEVEQRPRDPMLRMLLGLALYHQDKSRAAQEMAKAADLDQRNADYRRMLGLMWEAAGRPDDALRALTRAVELSPLDALVHGTLGRMYLRQGKAPQAGPVLARAVELDRGNFLLHFHLGRARRGMGQSERAARSFRRCTEIIRRDGVGR